MSAQEYPSTLRLESQTSDFHALQFMIEQAIGRISKVALVQVTKVSATGTVAGVGTVSVSPSVKMQDAMGNVHGHGDISNLTYFRLQGGKDKAIIMDPKIGDVGVALFFDRDISAAKKNLQGWDGTKKASEAQSPPGSYRQHDMADGIFLGCTLGGAPTSYFQFHDDGSITVSPDNGVTIVELKADQIKLKHVSSSIAVYVTPGRIDLGKLGAPHAVVTVDGPSLKVFAVIDEVDP